jgi:DnaJ domain
LNRYDILGVASDATPEQIRRAYRTLASKTHPDIGGPAMTPLFRSVQDAYETLSNPLRRAAYDRELGAARTPSAHREPAAREKPAEHQPEASAETEEEPRPDPGARKRPQEPRTADQAERAPKQRSRNIHPVWAAVLAVLFFAVSAFWLRFVSWFFMDEPFTTSGIYIAGPQGLTAGTYITAWFMSTVLVARTRHWAAWLAPFGAVVFGGLMVFATKTGYPDYVLGSFGLGLILTWIIAGTLRRQRR